MALVVTIIIIIILSTITINMAFGDNGLIKQAELAKDMAANSTTSELEDMNSLLSEYANLMAEDSEITGPGENTEISGNTEIGGGTEPDEPKVPTIADAKEDEDGFTEKTTVVDNKNNKIVVPAGFKIADDSGDTVEQGIVIEDVTASTDAAVQGSQYVWIPVGTFTKDDGSTSNEIKLGRYTFSETDGTPTLVQDATNYTDQSDEVEINHLYKELVDYRAGVASSGTNGRNATAKDLKGFIESVKTNGGYYIGRYEASFASGSSVADYKAASKVSTAKSINSMSYNPGTLWNFITQLDASKVAINTYAGNANVKSDLINSYAWDTAIVYIQECGHVNYANQTGSNDGAGLVNTGANNDEVCKINDMASNIMEYTTEYSNFFTSNNGIPCVSRGGSFNNGSTCYTAYRGSDYATTDNYNSIGFRLMLYM